MLSRDVAVFSAKRPASLRQYCATSVKKVQVQTCSSCVIEFVHDFGGAFTDIQTGPLRFC